MRGNSKFSSIIHKEEDQVMGLSYNLTWLGLGIQNRYLAKKALMSHVSYHQKYRAPNYKNNQKKTKEISKDNTTLKLCVPLQQEI